MKRLILVLMLCAGASWAGERTNPKAEKKQPQTHQEFLNTLDDDPFKNIQEQITKLQQRVDTLESELSYIQSKQYRAQINSVVNP